MQIETAQDAFIVMQHNTINGFAMSRLAP